MNIRYATPKTAKKLTVRVAAVTSQTGKAIVTTVEDEDESSDAAGVYE